MGFLNENGLSRLWLHIIDRLGGKADADHTHTAAEVGADTRGAAANALANAKVYTNEQLEPVAEIASNALPKSGGTMTGALALGASGNSTSVPLQFGRTMSDGSTKAIVQEYLTASGNYKTDLYRDGTNVNSITLTPTGINLTHPLGVTSGGTGATTAEGARANLGITPVDIGAVPMEGGKMTGALTLGSKNDTANVSLTVSRKGTDENGYEMQASISDGNAGAIAVYQTTEEGSAVVNRLILNDDSTSFKQPVDIAGGGTGANNAADARANLNITPENIGALATTGGKMTGRLTAGSITSQNSVPIAISRLGTDGATKYEMLHGISNGDEANILLYQGGVQANRMILGDERTTFDIPVDIAGGGTGANNAADARANLNITPENIGAVKKTGDNMTGTLVLGSIASQDISSLNINRLGTDGTTSYQMVHGISEGNAASILYYKKTEEGTTVPNRMTLNEEVTTFGKPVNIVGGGTGANNAADARTNLEITPENIGAQPAGDYALKSEIPSVPVSSVNGKTGAVVLTANDVDAVTRSGSSTVAGNITVGSGSSTDGRVLASTRLGTDNSVYSTQLGISNGDAANITFYKDGTMVNRMVLEEESTTFSKPVNIAGGGTGASSAAQARTNLGITPANIGAVSQSDFDDFSEATGNSLTAHNTSTEAHTDIRQMIEDITVPTQLSDLTADATHRLVTDTEKATWNAKSNFSGSYNDLTNKPSIPSIAGLATETYVDDAVAALVDSSPDTLNTLNELAAALGDDPNFATTVATQIGGKVDKVTGKGLSTNDYTTAEKEKLASIAAGAEENTVNSVNTQTGDVVLDAADVNALALTGGTLTGSLTIGSTSSKTNVPLTVKRLGTDGTTKHEVQAVISNGDEGTVAYYKDGTMANRMILGETRTSFKVPVDVAGGGTGATDAATARANLNITPANIGALPLSGGTMAGNLNMGTTSASDSRILTFGRLMSDGTTKAQTQTYLTGGGSLKTDLYQGGTTKNYLTLASDHVKIGQPLTIACDGAIKITAAGSSTVKHTLFSDKNLPTSEQISGLEAYINALIDAKLPAVTAADNGKFLRVVDGQWALVDIENAEDVTY